MKLIVLFIAFTIFSSLTILQLLFIFDNISKGNSVKIMPDHLLVCYNELLSKYTVILLDSPKITIGHFNSLNEALEECSKFPNNIIYLKNGYRIS